MKRNLDIFVMTSSRIYKLRAYTLAELIVSVAIMAVLVGGMASAILIAGHALPDDENPSEKLVKATNIVDRIAGELLYATSIAEVTANAVTFTVADRNHGDPGPETIRYDWSGTAGDPLSRQYNERAAADTR